MPSALATMRTMCATAVVAVALLTPVHAGAVSFGFHGGHHGYGLSIGHHGGHHGYHGRHRYGHGYSGYRHRSYSGYRHHGYRRHGYYRSRVYSHRYDDSYSTTSTDPYPSGESRSGRTGSPNADSNGWGLLIEGEPREALAVFSREAKSRPEDGPPKAGYALAAASSGDLDKGSWAMRRAFRHEPDALPGLAASLGAQGTVDQVIDQYEYEDDGGSADAAFMLAALHLLNGNQTAAQSAAENAVHAGDDSESLRNLARILSDGAAVPSGEAGAAEGEPDTADY